MPQKLKLWSRDKALKVVYNHKKILNKESNLIRKSDLFKLLLVYTTLFYIKMN